MALMAPPRPVEPPEPASVLEALVRAVVGAERAEALMATVEVHPVVAGPGADPSIAVPRATIAQALALVLFDDLCQRVPSAAGYVADCRSAGRRVVLDHAAVRTVARPCGLLPAGQEQVARLLRPLGYEQREVYDLTALRMIGRSWTHVDHPEAIPQWFVSELDLHRLSPEVEQAAAQLLASSTDALGLLDRLRSDQLARHAS
ncbi:MAG: calmodulin-binding protein, partial [Acidimicrobiales bacterium]|nr:calmodulin-binding protein [Acidimicrobiales bacterium]